MPVLPPLVVTRMDWESRIHTVLSSCLSSGALQGSLELEPEEFVLEEELDTLLFVNLNGGFQTCVPVNPAAFVTSSCERRPTGVLDRVAFFRGATC